MTLRWRTAALGAALVAALSAAWGGFAVTAAEASSRLALVSSDPPADTAVAHLPSEVVLTFNQPLLASTVISVSAPDGATLASGPVSVHGDTAHVSIAGPGTAGVYTVAYTAGDDQGRSTPGSFAFTVTTGPSPAGRTGGHGHSASPAPATVVTVAASPAGSQSPAPVAVAVDNPSLTISSTPAWWTFAGAALIVACVLVVFIGFRRRAPANSGAPR